MKAGKAWAKFLGGPDAPKPKRKHKYAAVKTLVEGVRYDSKREAVRAQELAVLERAGVIRDLSRQVRFVLSSGQNPIMIRSSGYPNGRHATYVADFTYHEDGRFVVEDVKGFDTPVSRLKRAIMEAMHPDWIIRVTR